MSQSSRSELISMLKINRLDKFDLSSSEAFLKDFPTSEKLKEYHDYLRNLPKG